MFTLTLTLSLVELAIHTTRILARVTVISSPGQVIHTVTLTLLWLPCASMLTPRILAGLTLRWLVWGFAGTCAGLWIGFTTVSTIQLTLIAGWSRPSICTLATTARGTAAIQTFAPGFTPLPREAGGALTYTLFPTNLSSVQTSFGVAGVAFFVCPIPGTIACTGLLIYLAAIHADRKRRRGAIGIAPQALLEHRVFLRACWCFRSDHVALRQVAQNLVPLTSVQLPYLHCIR